MDSLDEFELANYEEYLRSLEAEKKEAIKDSGLTATSLVASLLIMKIPYEVALDLTLRQLMEVIEEIGKENERRNKQKS